jgi:ABC-type oligopeptide transport system ATPase subunit
MLDVSIRDEILNMLRQLRDDHGITILYITHNLATAAYFCRPVAASTRAARRRKRNAVESTLDLYR